jgi:hypothetical protein
MVGISTRKTPERLGAAVLRDSVEVELSEGPGTATLGNSVEVFQDLVGPRPLLWGDHKIDVCPSGPVHCVIRRAGGIDTHGSKLVAPRQSGRLLLEYADGLPALQAWVAD